MAKGQPFDFAVLVLHTTVLKTPAKRSQHVNATLLGATCCVRLTTMLGHVAACCQLKIELVRMPKRNIVARTWPNDYNIKWNIFKCFVKNLIIFKFESTTPSMSQHITTRRNRVAKRTQHVAPNNVAICCVEMLRSFARGFMQHPQKLHERFDHY